ncbi:MAG: hypothetical protein PHQ33_08150 [Bacteroidales bacterium]|nr:hypothetical protein [Bacteroidales bacterium]
MKRCYILVVILVFLSIIMFSIYYFVPRHVDFELIKTIEQPDPFYDRTEYKGFDYIYSQDDLWFWLREWYSTDPILCDSIVGYDSTFIAQLTKELDCNNYDYIITYQKKLLLLNYSPYLTQTKDRIYWDKKIPLIPSFDTIFTDSVYIYRIKNYNNKFRHPGP